MNLDIVSIVMSVITASLCGGIAMAISGKPWSFAANFVFSQVIWWSVYAFRSRRKKA